MACQKPEVPCSKPRKNLYPERKWPKEENACYPRYIDTDRFSGWREAITELEPDDVRLPDMIVTVLQKYSQKVLEAFLNKNHKNVAFYRCEENAGHPDFFIKKHGKFMSESHI